MWTPERHFHAFGGLYPNPSVTSAAIAAITTRVAIRAGSVVLPLHHPIRVAEEWAVVDNLSSGRVGISFASGWQPNDFVLRAARPTPTARSDARRASRWCAGCGAARRSRSPGRTGKPVEVRTLPRPVQPELPVWVTTAGNPETFAAGGRDRRQRAHPPARADGRGASARRSRVYRAAWREAGHAGDGHVTLMLHTFVGEDDDEVRETVREPLKDYLRELAST